MGSMKAKSTVYPVFRLGTESSVVCGSPPIHQVITPRTTRPPQGSGEISLFPKMTWKRSFGGSFLHRKRL